MFSPGQVMLLLIGSQAIQLIALRHEHDDYMRRVNVKIAVLREVIERLHKGEDVDVERMLGVGDEKEEKSWEDGKLSGPLGEDIFPPEE